MTLQEFRAVSRRLGFRPRVGLGLLVINLIGTVFESIGLGILLPVFQFIQTKGDIASLTAEHRLWRLLVECFEFMHIPLTVTSLLVASFLCILSRQAFLYLRLVWVSIVKSRLVRDIRDLGFRRYFGTNTTYRDAESIGNVVNSLTTELNLAIEVVFTPVALANLAVMAVIYVTIMSMLSPQLTAAAVVLFVFSALALRRMMRPSRLIGIDMANANRDISSFLVERLKSARLVILSGTEKAETRHMEALTDHQCTRKIQLSALQAALDIAIEPVVVGIGLTFLFFGTTRFNLRLEEMSLFLVIVIRLLPVVKDMMKVWQGTISTLGSLESLDRRLRAMEAAQEVKSGSRVFSGLQSSIEFRHVEFRYHGREIVPALNGVDLHIPVSKMTALVGPSGSGKSTLIDLLPRFREPTSGQVLLDGCPINQYSLSSLRAGIAYVPQSPQLFNVTVEQHIRYGRADASGAEIHEATRLAGVDEFIRSLPERYETVLGESGVFLSGGQRQRLDLARALVRKSSILILDEPTSNLDADAEDLFRDALRRIQQATAITIIIVGHRLSTVVHADKIVVLNQGRVEDSGTHAELLARGRWYAQAFRKQHGDLFPVGQAEGIRIT